MMASLAGGQETPSVSLAPSLRGGVMGIKDASYSSLAYHGPFVGIGLCLSAHDVLFVDAAYAHGWIGNNYHREPSTMYSNQGDLSVGGMIGNYENQNVSMKAGAFFGFMGNRHVVLPFQSRSTIALDAKGCLSAELKLPQCFSLSIEERLPLIASLWAFSNIQNDIPSMNADHSLKAFPGNDVRVGLCRHLRNGCSWTLFLRHYCYSSGDVLPDHFQLQYLELGFSYRFDL